MAPESPTPPDPDPDRDLTDRLDTDSVDRVVADYFAALEANPDADLAVEPFLSRLQSDSERALAKRLVRHGERAFRSDGVLREGTVLDGRYRLIERIGAGGMGAVWRAEDRNVGAEVAVKVLNPVASKALGAAERVAAEVDALGRIEHPGVVAVRDFHPHEDFTYFVMDLVDGTPLSELIRGLRGTEPRPNGRGLATLIGREPPPGIVPPLGNDNWYRSVARLVVETLRVLEATHARHVVHRDIKPSNILLRGGGTPVLLDFGLARDSADLSKDLTQALSGTIPYLAPEQVRTHRTGASPATDVYQMGAVLFELLTLERAIEGEHSAALLANIDKGAVRDPARVDPRVPREIADVCLCAMERSLDRRYRSATAFREDLERALDGHELPRASRGSWWRRTRFFTRRHRVPLGILATVAITTAFVWGLAAPAPDAYTIVESPTYSTELLGDRRRVLRVAQAIEFHEPCDVHLLLFVERNNQHEVHPMFLAGTERAVLDVEPGAHEMQWTSAAVEPFDSYRVDLFVTTVRGAMRPAIQNIVRMQRDLSGGYGVPLIVAKNALRSLDGAARGDAHGDSPFTADMIVGDAPMAPQGRRITLVDSATKGE